MATRSLGEVLVDYFKRARWLQIYLVVEVLLIVGGLAAQSQGRIIENEISSQPDFWLTMGGVLGVLAFVFGVLLVVALTGGVSLRLYRYYKDPIEG